MVNPPAVLASLGPLMFIGMGLYYGYSGVKMLRTAGLVASTGTDEIRSVTTGRTEVTGTATPTEGPVERPLDDGDCLIVSYEVEEYKSDYVVDDADWDTVASGVIGAPFELDDGTGRIRVEPDETTTVTAEATQTVERSVGFRETEPPDLVEFLETYTDLEPTEEEMVAPIGSQRTYTQQWIDPGESVYVLGGAQRETAGHDPVIGQDPDSGRFIVSNKDGSEVTTDSLRGALAELGFALFACLAGLWGLDFLWGL